MSQSKYKADFEVIFSGEKSQIFMIPIYSTIVQFYNSANEQNWGLNHPLEYLEV